MHLVSTSNIAKSSLLFFTATLALIRSSLMSYLSMTDTHLAAAISSIFAVYSTRLVACEASSSMDAMMDECSFSTANTTRTIFVLRINKFFLRKVHQSIYNSQPQDDIKHFLYDIYINI
jgi:hypothetical protein